MTMTVKLAPELEQRLRLRSQGLGKPASVLIREALSAYLDAPPATAPSAYALGLHVFGKHQGPANLASHRKETLADIFATKHDRRSRRG
jgi:hypothetical protein